MRAAIAQSIWAMQSKYSPSSSKDLSVQVKHSPSSSKDLSVQLKHSPSSSKLIAESALRKKKARMVDLGTLPSESASALL